MCNVTRVRRLPTLSPSSVTACGGATFPRQGGRLIGATNDTAVQSSKCQCWSLPPSGGRWLAEGQTDEGEAEGLRYFTNLAFHSFLC